MHNINGISFVGCSQNENIKFNKNFDENFDENLSELRSNDVERLKKCITENLTLRKEMEELKKKVKYLSYFNQNSYGLRASER